MDREKIFEIFRKLIERNSHEGPACCHGMSRKDFLKATGMVIAGTAVPLGGLLSCSDSNANPTDEGIQISKPAAPTGTASVAAVRGADVETMVRDAIEMAGGLGEIQYGDTVVIKPNITAGYITGMNFRVNTSKDVIAAVIKAVKTRTPAQYITLAEASAFNLPTEFWAKEQGIYDICMNEGINFMAWETGEYATVTSKDFSFIDFKLRVPKSLVDGSFEHFINVPMLKNHDMVRGAVDDFWNPWEATDVDYTCCIKNHVGCIHPLNRVFGGEETMSDAMELPVLTKGIHQSTLGETSAELNLVVPKHTMNVVDALTIVLTGGPAAIYMDLAHPDMVLASKDRVACDSFAVAMLKYYADLFGIKHGTTINRPYVGKSVWQQAQIIRAQQLNLGRTREHIVISQQGVDDFSAMMERWC